MSNKSDAAFHGSTLRDELLRAAPFSDDEGLLRRAAERIAELEADRNEAWVRDVSNEAYRYHEAACIYKLHLAKAWDEGAVAGWSESGEGWNAEYPGRPFEARETSNPYRNP